MNALLWQLCERDQLNAIYDQVCRAHFEGNTHALHLAKWLNRVRNNITPITPKTCKEIILQLKDV